MSLSDKIAARANEPPHARIQRLGRFWYLVTVNDGLMQRDIGKYYLGLRWAKWGARRNLRRFCKKLAYRDQVMVIGEGVCDK